MAEASAIFCPGCQQLQTQLDAQRVLLEQVQATVARLQEQLAAARKDSSTSSKPPSSDIVKPPPPPLPPGQAKRAAGGQPGHAKHERPLLPPEQVDHSFVHSLDCCPCRGGKLRPSGCPDRVVQQVDLLPPRLVVEQHCCPEYWCGGCQRAFKAPLPGPIERGGLAGPRLTALAAYLKGACHASFSTIRKFLRDVAGVAVSRGLLAKLVAKVSEALRVPYEELLAALPGEDRLNVDETGHKDNGKLMWTWVFRAQMCTLFKIDPHRSADVLMEVLGKEFDGVLGCDHFSACRRYMRECGAAVRFRLARLIRDVKFLATLPGKQEREHGERLRESVRALFGLVHRRGEMAEPEFQRRLKAARDKVLRAGTEGVPAGRHAQTMAKRLSAYGADYFTFVTTPGVQPTNNLAEQAIRFVVIDRLVTQGTRSEGGRNWSERIWTVLATCVQQGREAFAYLGEAVSAWSEREDAPSLLPAR